MIEALSQEFDAKMRVSDKPVQEETDIANFKPTFIAKKRKGDAVMKEQTQCTVPLSFDEEEGTSKLAASQTSEPKLKFGRRKKVVKETA